MIARDRKLYALVKKEADAKFLAKTSAYKSAWIVREYKKRGGEFESKRDDSKGLIRWFKEKWVDLNRSGRPCGRNKASSKGTYPLCRPSIRVTPDTPRLERQISPIAIESAKREKGRIKHKGRISFDESSPRSASQRARQQIK